MTEERPRLTLAQVDYTDLASFIDSHDQPGAFLDPETGEIYPSFDYEVLGPDGEPVDMEEVDWLPVGGEGSGAAYDDMVDFAEAVADPGVRRKLTDSLRGRGAFRRFKDTMWHQPEEIGRAWNRYRDGRAELRALDWLLREDLVAEAEVDAARRQVLIVLEEALAQVGQRQGTGIVVDLAEKLGQISEQWSPKTVARLNDYEVKLVKLQGEFVWHSHEDTDELFLVVDGRLTIRLRDDDVVLGPGQLYVVPAGVEHCPVTDGEVSAMLIEPAGVVNTGDADTDRTAVPDHSLLD